MTHKDIARAIANAYKPPKNGNELIVRYYRGDGTATVSTEEAQYISRYNPLTKRLRVMLYPHRDMVGLFYLGN